MKKYFYLVSYHYVDGNISGFGDAGIDTNNPITTYEEVTELRKKIEEWKGSKNFKAAILNFILLHAEEAE